MPVTADLRNAEIDVLVARIELALLRAVGRVGPMAGRHHAVEHDLTHDGIVYGRNEGDERRRVGVVDEGDDLVHRVVASLVGPVEAGGAWADRRGGPEPAVWVRAPPPAP